MTKVKGGGRTDGWRLESSGDGWVDKLVLCQWRIAAHSYYSTSSEEFLESFCGGGARSGFYTFHYSSSGRNKMMVVDCKGSGNADFVFLCQSLRPLANKNQQVCWNNPDYLLFLSKNKSRPKDNVKIDACPHYETFTGQTHGLLNKMKGDVELVGEWQEDADNRVRWKQMIWSGSPWWEYVHTRGQEDSI